MDSPAGLVALAVFVVWLAYFVPTRLRNREQVSAARTDDRFSARLRVLAVSGGASLTGAPGGDCPMASQRTDPLLTPPVGMRGVGARRITPMERVHDVERSGISAARREQLARRRAAARRRALVTAALATITVVLVAVAVVTPLAMLWVLVPGSLLGGALVLGRRAAVADARADAELRRRDRVALRARDAVYRSAQSAGERVAVRPAPVVKPRTTGHVAVSSQSPLEALAAVPRDAVDEKPASDSPAESRRGQRDDSQPVVRTSTPEQRPDQAPGGAHAGAEAAGAGTGVRPVPRPTYAVKPAAPRWEPAPLSTEIERVTRHLERWDEEEMDLVAAEAVTDGSTSSGAVMTRADAPTGEARSIADGYEDGAGASVKDVKADGIGDGDGTAVRATGSLGGGLDGILDRRRAAGE